jgi:hypothetical protein
MERNFPNALQSFVILRSPEELAALRLPNSQLRIDRDCGFAGDSRLEQLLGFERASFLPWHPSIGFSRAKYP